MSILTIMLWLICAIITCGALIHTYPDEWGCDGAPLCMLVSIVGWPLFAIMGIAHIVLKRLSKMGLFFAGLFDRILKKEE